MEKQPSSLFSMFVRFSRPAWLLAGILSYSLGGGLARYLGHIINWTNYFIGLACIIMLQISSYYLKEYYDLLEVPASYTRNRNKSKRAEDEPDPVNPRQPLLLASVTTLTVGAVLTVLLYADKAFNQSLLVILGIAFFIAFFYAVPPLRLVYSGYGELAQALLIANLAPAFAFLVQASDLHRLLPMLTFPVTALFLAMMIVFSLQDYASDLKQDRKTLLVRLGWQRGMALHNILILFAYLLLVFAAFLGLPWHLTWPGLLSLPIGLFQIWQMWQISIGSKPRWGLLNFTSLASVLLTAYLLVLALWTS
jgi:1,4-dihydroxy-2-naphthoate octaprenyltransferase